uniref:ER lumen protein-retaining receptor n=1 Tax=Emiliania huxleyi TaxID=2903 RepID=A0A6V2SDQ8_EMIHU|mmetsp:Transcript_27227/g.81223  ORF Transcript_27227/g.81223 Transcript_27227/m.81223 type:complete len:219 (+) Transcript_27227:93-749(+)
MNIFRFLGDMSHILSFLLLLHKIVGGKSAAGISLRTAEMYAVVFCTRYIDLLWNFASLYNYLLKLLFIGASLTIVYFMRYGPSQKATYNADEDAFPVQYLIAPCAVLGVLINQDHSSPFEMVWAFSIYLEAVAILPQLFLLQKQGEVENLTSHYVFALGAYRALYLLNWMFRFMTEPDYQQRIVWLSGLVQTALYCDFFYHYYQSKKGGLNKSVKLPV